MRTSEGSLSGRADVEMDFSPGPLNYDSLKGTAQITAYDLKTFDFPIQRALVQLLSIPQFSDLHFDKLKADLEIKQQGIMLTEMSGNGEMLELKAKGWAGADGTMNQEVEGVLSEAVVMDMSEAGANSLEKIDNNRRGFKCRIYGDFMNPKIELDKALLKRAVGSMFRNMKEGFQDFFRKNR